MHRPDDQANPQLATATKHAPESPLANGPLVIVGGCGHVGLTLGLAFARQGHQVDLLDTSPERVAAVNQGKMPFLEEGADELLVELLQKKLVKATTDFSAVDDASAVIVTIGTPVDEYLDPAVSAFDRAIKGLLDRLRPGQLLVLRSTVFPGVTDRLSRQLEQMGRADIDLAYCPERIAQGKSLVELAQLPQLIGGTTPRAAQRAAALFRIITPKTIFLKPIEAELAKLFCNAWRYINFAISNQFYVMAEQFGADFHRIYSALREDYPRMGAFARPGFAAGPCLVKDTMQLGAFNHGSFVLGQAAMMINEGLPYLLVQSVKARYPLSELTVGVLGMAFKPNNDDPRDSLSYKLRKVLLLECKHLLCSDPYVKDDSLVPLSEVLEKADVILIGTPHDCYKSIKFRQPVVDVSATLKNATEAAVVAVQPVAESPR